MKTTSMLINYLMVYPTEQVTISKVNKVKGTRAGALILQDELPRSDGQRASRAIELSAKQLTHLCGMFSGYIRSEGKDAWHDLASYIGNYDSVAIVSYEEYKKGDGYVDSDNNPQVYTETWTKCSLDGIKLPAVVTNTFRDKVMEKNANWTKQTNEVGDLMQKLASKGIGAVTPVPDTTVVPEPSATVLEGVK